MTWAKPQNSTFSNSPILVDDRPITVRRRVGDESSSATGRFSSPHPCSSSTESLFIDEWVTKYSSATGRFSSPHPSATLHRGVGNESSSATGRASSGHPSSSTWTVTRHTADWSRTVRVSMQWLPRRRCPQTSSRCVPVCAVHVAVVLSPERHSH